MKRVELHSVFYANCHLVTVKYTFRDSRRFITKMEALDRLFVRIQGSFSS